MTVAFLAGAAFLVVVAAAFVGAAFLVAVACVEARGVRCW